MDDTSPAAATTTSSSSGTSTSAAGAGSLARPKSTSRAGSRSSDSLATRPVRARSRRSLFLSLLLFSPDHESAGLPLFSQMSSTWPGRPMMPCSPRSDSIRPSSSGTRGRSAWSPRSRDTTGTSRVSAGTPSVSSSRLRYVLHSLYCYTRAQHRSAGADNFEFSTLSRVTTRRSRFGGRATGVWTRPSPSRSRAVQDRPSSDDSRALLLSSLSPERSYVTDSPASLAPWTFPAVAGGVRTVPSLPAPTP